MKISISYLKKIIKEEIETVKNDITVTGQKKPGYCGPASLRAILRFYKDPQTEEKLASLSDASIQDGTKAENIIKAAEQLGYIGKILDNNKLHHLRIALKKGPVIINWFDDGGHYSVASGMNDEEIFFMDPSEGGSNRKLPLEQFKEQWFDFEGDDHTNIVRNRMIIIRPKK